MAVIFYCHDTNRVIKSLVFGSLWFYAKVYNNLNKLLGSTESVFDRFFIIAFDLISVEKKASF